MLSFFEFLCNNLYYIVAFSAMGSIMAIFNSLGESWNTKLFSLIFCVGLYGFGLGTLVSHTDYLDYKRHWLTCEKYEAKKAGYIFANDKCWKPVKSYVKVDEQVKTKEELLNAK